MALNEKSAKQILGYIDALKFRSCLTLFAIACDPDPVFQKALDKYFGGQRDSPTAQALCVKPR